MRVLARRLPTTRCLRSALDLLLGKVDVLLPDEVPDADGTSPARCLHGRVIRAVFASTSAMR
jgi:hypothetical protein